MQAKPFTTSYTVDFDSVEDFVSTLSKMRKYQATGGNTVALTLQNEEGWRTELTVTIGDGGNAYASCNYQLKGDRSFSKGGTRVFTIKREDEELAFSVERFNKFSDHLTHLNYYQRGTSVNTYHLVSILEHKPAGLGGEVMDMYRHFIIEGHGGMSMVEDGKLHPLIKAAIYLYRFTNQTGSVEAS